VASKVRVIGETDNAGVGAGAATTNVTVIVAGLFWAPVAATVMCPVYVPAVRLPTVAEISSVCGAVPLVGVAESQEESLLVVKVNVPAPPFVMLAAAGEGFVALPCVPLKVTEDCETPKIGAVALELPYADKVQVDHFEPGDQAEGRLAKFVCALLWLMQLDPVSRKSNVPPVPKIAIQ